MSTWLNKFKDTQGSLPDKTDKSPSKEPLNQELKNEKLLIKLKMAGVSSRWQEYLIERLDILIKFESYSPEQAREEVLQMAKLPFYQGLN